MAATMRAGAPAPGVAQARAMADRPGPQAGGFIIAVAIVAGTIVGGLNGQPSIGLLAGLGLGVAAAVAVWLVDRRRR